MVDACINLDALEFIESSSIERSGFFMRHIIGVGWVLNLLVVIGCRFGSLVGGTVVAVLESFGTIFLIVCLVHC